MIWKHGNELEKRQDPPVFTHTCFQWLGGARDAHSKFKCSKHYLEFKVTVQEVVRDYCEHQMLI